MHKPGRPVWFKGIKNNYFDLRASSSVSSVVCGLLRRCALGNFNGNCSHWEISGKSVGNLTPTNREFQVRFAKWQSPDRRVQIGPQSKVAWAQCLVNAETGHVRYARLTGQVERSVRGVSQVPRNAC